MKASEKAAVVASGRRQLRAWLKAAEKRGTIYYAVTHVARSGMSRRIVLQTIRAQGGKPVLWNLFPSLRESDVAWRDHAAQLDIVAKDWGFSFEKRAFIVGGCGKDMVFALVDNLATIAGLRETGAASYANRVRRESFT